MLPRPYPWCEQQNLVTRQPSEDFLVESTPGYAIGWGTLSLINAGLAQAKNRSGLAWWLFSLFLGPIATFLIVVLDAPSGAGK